MSYVAPVSPTRGPMPVWVRAASFVLVVPGTIAGWLPWYIALRDERTTMPGPIVRAAGGVLFTTGWLVLMWGTLEFVRRGRGTPAPYDPPQRLVTSGLYGIVRNPMYVAVLCAIVGVAVWGWSDRVMLYAAAVAVAFHLRVVFYEERILARTFGEEFARYRSEVPRWLPMPRFPLRR